MYFLFVLILNTSYMFIFQLKLLVVCTIFVKVHLSTFRASRDAVFSILLSAKRFDPGGLLQ